MRTPDRPCPWEKTPAGKASIARTWQRWINKPGNRERKRAREKKYRARPEVAARRAAAQKAYQRANAERIRANYKAWAKTPRGVASARRRAARYGPRRRRRSVRP